jgi:hypothetical protein
MNEDASQFTEGWVGDWPGSYNSQIRLSADGTLYWLLSGGYPDNPTPEWTIGISTARLNAPFEHSTVRVRRLAADGKSMLESRSASVGNLAQVGHTSHGNTIDSIITERRRFMFVGGGWSVVNFGMSTDRLQFPLQENYKGGFYYGDDDTFAKLASVKGSGALPQQLSATPVAFPTISAAGFSPTFANSGYIQWRPIIEDANDVEWYYFSSDS